MNAYFSLLGRIGLSLIFLISGWGKIAGYAATQGYMESVVSRARCCPWSSLSKSVAAWRSSPALSPAGSRLACAVFSIAAALIFHANLADQMQAILFWKNFAIAGGFLLLAANGPGPLSLDASFSRRRVVAAT